MSPHGWHGCIQGGAVAGAESFYRLMIVVEMQEMLTYR
jgi:hypothetical protein